MKPRLVAGKTYIQRRRGRSIGVATVSPYDPAADAFFARVPPQTDTMKTAYNNVFLGLRSAGFLSRFACLFLPDAVDPDTALQDLLSATKAIPMNSPVFTQYRGYQFDGTSSYLRSGINLFAHPNFLQDSGSLLWRIRNNVDGAHFDMGARASGTVSQTAALTRFGGNFRGRLNTDSAELVEANTNSIGGYILSRTASNLTRYYKDGGLRTPTSVAASVAIYNGELYFGAINTGGTASGFSPRAYNEFGAINGLTEAEAGQLNSILAAFHVVTGS